MIIVQFKKKSSELGILNIPREMMPPFLHVYMQSLFPLASQ